jgi:hypothetical protein
MILQDLKNKWVKENITCQTVATPFEIEQFNKRNNVQMPHDLVTYFELINGTNDEYDSDFFRFTSFDEFSPIDEVYKEWNGIPNFQNIVNTLNDYNNFYVIADYQNHLFSYAIKLTSNVDNNIVLAVCGDKYKEISSSFSKFIEMVLSSSDSLQF